jgi:hypothetical protein
MKPKRSPLTAEEKERGKTLFASGKTIYKVAKTLGRSPHTLAKFLRKPEIVKEVNIQREELAGMFDGITHRTLAGVTDEDIRKSSLQQKMVSAGIAVDKAAMLRGELPPTINMVAVMDLVEILKLRQQQPALPPHEYQS